MKKNLQMTALAVALAIGSVSAQTGKVVANGSAVTPAVQNGPNDVVIRIPNRGCGTGVPDAQWEAAFQKQIQEFLAKNSMTNGKVQSAAYTIPVIIHVIHGGQAVGTYPNLAQGQLNSQIAVLNADYGGTGFNTGTYPATAFQSYASSTVALSASLTAASKDGSGRVAIMNTNVQFCLATKDSLGNLLAEPGIERINYISKGWANPTSFSTPTTFQTFIDGTVKPQTVWNVSKYLNMWVTDENLGSVGLLGYATFPVSSGNTGLPGPYGSATTDGFWAYAKCIGSQSIFPGGVYDPTYKYGRTCTHEIGHWLGLRHIWGDGGQCGATDYCVDTPPQKGTTGPPAGCYYGTPAYPANANGCTRPDGYSNASVKNLNGDMFMNFMDYTDDVAMYMFTNDQTTRIQTTMANSPYRKFLGTHGLCSVAAASPTVNITVPASGCTGTGVAMVNNSLGTPSPTYVWSTSPSAGVTFNPSSTATTPTITFPSAGIYSVTCVATNSLGTANQTKTISITACAALCNDTIMNVTNTATLTLATAGSDTTTPGCSPKAGYLCGSNCYQDKEKAEYFPLSMYSSISTPKIVSVICIFYNDGTKGTGGAAATAVSMKLYTGTMAGGPTATTVPIGTVNSNLGTISAAPSTTNITYCGSPSVAYINPILKPYRFVFGVPVPAPATNGFFASLKVPTTAGDTAVVMHASATTGTNWELWSDNTWHNLSTAWGGFNCNMAILPEITCNPVGVNQNSVLDRNVTIMPNPSTGMFNIVTTLPTQNINITVTNALGQTISDSEFTSVSNNVISIDLTSKDNGVYFISIRNGEERIVKRVIVAK